MILNILRKIYTFFIDTIQTLLLVFAIFLIVYIFLFRPFQVNGNSMHPNFFHKQYILTNIIVLQFKKPILGDVVIFRAPPDPEKDYIKRVIGIPGDAIFLKDGEVYLNGKLLDEKEYIVSTMKTYGGTFIQEEQTIIVPKNSYFVMGDNRLESSDSREWGFVSTKAIIGQSFFTYWPLNQIGIVKNPYFN